MGCAHHWYIKDDEKYHQIGNCQKCGQTKDFGINPTIVTDKGLITTRYWVNPFTSKLKERPTFEDREYQYPKPIDSQGHYIKVIEPDENDEGYWDNL